MKILTKVFTLLAFVCLFMAVLAVTSARAATVSVEGKSVVSGESFAAEVRLSGNSDNITSMVIPIVIGDAYITCTGVDFTGSLDAGDIVKSFNVSGQEIYIYYLPANDAATSEITAASGVIATLQLEVSPSAPDVFVFLDAIELDKSFEANGQFYGYWNRIEFADETGGDVLLPGFSPGLITVQHVTDIADGSNDLIPDTYELNQNFPNPFNPSTVIKFALPQRSNVRLEIFNLLGQKITTLVNTEMEAGYHDVTWEASTAPSGVYFYRLIADETSFTRKMMLLK